jgi:hypothetical protein
MQNSTIATMSDKARVLLFVCIIAGFLLSFFSGFIFKSFFTLSSGGTTDVLPTPSPTAKAQIDGVDNGSDTVQQQMEVGKKYFLDTVIMVSKKAPNYSFVTSVSRVEKEGGYTQNVRTSYFNGEKWVRKLKSTDVPSRDVQVNSLLTSWSERIDSTRVLKETVEGTENFDDVRITFKTDELQNEIGMRSLPSNTKFMSSGEGSFTLNGEEHQAYVLYTKQYSDNAAEIQVYDGSLGITTNWLAFWDEDGEFYHVDVTKVERPTATYQSHQIGVFEDTNKKVSKTFSVDVEMNETIPPTFYTIELKEPIYSKIQLELLNQYDKVPTQNSYRWILGQVQGEVVNAQGEKKHGIGLLEYIYN